MDTTTSQRTRKELKTPGNVVIAFTHEKGAWPMQLWKKGKRIEVVATRRTLCTLTLVNGSGEFRIGYGEATCSPSDTFEYELGRQVALYDALQTAARQTQREVMVTYLQRPGAKPWRLDREGHLRESDECADRLRAAMQIANLVAALL